MKGLDLLTFLELTLMAMELERSDQNAAPIYSVLLLVRHGEPGKPRKLTLLVAGTPLE